MEPEKPLSVAEGEIDLLNDETFGDGAVEDDWEAGHLAEVGGEGSGLPTEALHNDDAILKAMPTAKVNHTPYPNQHTEEELDSSIADLSLKELWPSSPKQVSRLESIWSSPEIPRHQDHAQATPTRGGVPPGQKVISVEELERELTSSPPLSSSPAPPPPQHTSPIPQHNRSPPPPHMMYLPHHPPPPPGTIPLPIHPFLSRGGWQLRGPPPPPHLLPPHMLHHPHPHTRHPHPPGGVPPYHLPFPRPPPHPHFPHPPQPHHYPLLHPPPPQSLHQHPPREHSPRRSRQSELLSEMKGDGSGFMTQKEKEWVVKIQLLQLQGSDPSNDDYYYQNYVQRKARRESADSAPSALSLPQVSREEKKYRPIEFKQTLGKVPQSSLTAPRKTIDAPSGVVEGGGGGGREITARRRQVLLTIEKLYSYILSLEDIDRRALALSEGERGGVLARKERVCAEVFSLLRLKTLDEGTGRYIRFEEQMFQQITSYRKGKRLLKRVLPILTDAHAQAVLVAILRNILTIIKRDITDQVLPELMPALKGVVMTCDLQLTSRCLTALLSLHTGASGAVGVVKVASCGFGSSLLLCLVRRGQLLCNSPYKTPQLLQDWLAAVDLLHSTLSPHSHQLSSSPSNTTLLTLLVSPPVTTGPASVQT